MESNRWKIILFGMIAIIPIVFLVSHTSSPQMIHAEKDIPDETLVSARMETPVSLKTILSGKHSFVYFGCLSSQSPDKIRKFLAWFRKENRKDSQFVFISLSPEKDNQYILREKLGNFEDKVLLLKPKDSSSAFELARAFGIQAYIVPELDRLRSEDSLIWVDESPKIRGIFPKYAETPESIQIPRLLVQAK